MSFSKLVKLACLPVVLLFGSLAIASEKSSFDLFVAAKDNSKASAAAATRGFGLIVGRDSKTGLYELKLKAGLDAKSAKLALRSGHKLKVAIGPHADKVDKDNIDSVDDHVAYLERLNGDAGRHEEKTERPQLDWWEAYRYWLNDRVDQYGNYDPEWFYRAAEHRDQMPAAQMTTAGEMNPDLTSGKWGYVGPKNLDIPYQIYYGAPPLIGRVNSIAVDPTNGKVIYIGGAGGGVFKTSDGGTTWVPLGDKWKFMQVSSIAIDPSAHNTLYVGTGDFDGFGGYCVGVMKSTDGGTTWTNYGASTFNGIAISKIMVDPQNSSVVMATAGRGRLGLNGGIFRSSNAGATWAHVSGDPGAWMDDMDVSVANSSGVRTWWAIGESFSGSTDVPFFKSTNEGVTWTPVSVKPFKKYQHGAVRLACSKLSATTVYVLDPDTHFSGAAPSDDHIWKSTNSGASWADIHVNPGFPNSFNTGDYYNWSQDNYDYHIHTSKVGAVDAVYVGLITVAMSYDAGAHWVDLGITYHSNSKTHNDQHSFAVDPVDPNTVYIGSDGGIFRALYAPSTHTATYTSLNKSLAISQFYHIAIHPTDATRVMGGTQDNAGPASAGDLNNWINPGAGDGAFVAYDPFDSTIAYSGTQGLAINRTTDGWASTNSNISATEDFNGESVNFIPPFTLANKGTAPSVLYAGTDHLWSWDPTHLWRGDLGATTLTSRTIRFIATCPSNAKELYTGGDDGALFVTGSLGSTWREVDSGAFGAPVVAISPTPTNAADVLVGVTHTGGTGNLYRCTNTGATTPVWSNAVSGSGSTALPLVPINAILRDPYAPTTTWYVATDVGVFMTTNSGTTWANMTGPLGLPNVQVNDLKASASTGYMYAGTFGRGMWRIRIVNPAKVDVSKVALSPTSVTGGTSSTLTVYLNTTAPYGGSKVTLSSSSTNATVPLSVTVPNGASSVKVTVTTKAVAATTTATISAKILTTHSAVLTITH